jgi:hypothetical protein
MRPHHREAASGGVRDLSGLTEEQQRTSAYSNSGKFLGVAGSMGARVIPTPEERDFFAALRFRTWSLGSSHRVVGCERQSQVRGRRKVPGPFVVVFRGAAKTTVSANEPGCSRRCSRSPLAEG